MEAIIIIAGFILGIIVNVFIKIIPESEKEKCLKKITWKSVIVNFITILLTYGIFIENENIFFIVKFSVMTAILLIIGIIDLETTDVYESTIYLGVIAAVIFVLVEIIIRGASINIAINYLLGGVIGFIIMGAIYYFTGGLGFGDVQISIVCGMFLGWKLEIIYMLISFIVGGVMAAFLLITKRKSRKDYIPLGPALTIGAYITILLGERLLNLYGF